MSLAVAAEAAAFPDAAGTALAFVLGAVIGSFLAAILVRWPQGRSIAQGRSHCEACGRTLSPRDLIPILSWFLVRGRCRHCGAKIDKRLLAIEAGGALIGLTAILAHPMPTAIFTAIFGWWLFLLAALDAEHHWLPDRLTLALLLAGLPVAWIGIGPALDDRLIGAVVGYAALAATGWAYLRLRGREGLGGGDPKLFAAIGAWIGWQALPYVLLGAGAIGLAGVAMMRLNGTKLGAADRLPLGTLMALAAWPAWLLLAA